LSKVANDSLALSGKGVDFAIIRFLQSFSWRNLTLVLSKMQLGINE